MKVFTLVSLFTAASWAAEASEAAEAAAWAAYETLAGSEKDGEKILPRFSTYQPLDGAKRVKSTLGPYTIQSAKMTKKNVPVRVPCPFGGCLITGMEATIRYPNGKVANVDTGAWMHHIAMFGSMGKGGGGGLLSGGSGGIWAAGNERPTLRLNSAQHKYGLDVSNYFMIIDLMSEDSKAKNVTLEITYEVVPKTKSGYKAATMYWLTIGEPAAKKGVYSFTTMPMTAKSGGQLLYAIGHMHDGGTDMVLKVNNVVKCTSKMFYNAREGYGKKEGGAAMSSGKMAGGHSHKMRMVKRQHAHGSGEGEHISDPGACVFFGSVPMGAQLKAVANYDANKHPLMMHNGKAEKLMGNMRVYIGPN